VICPYDKNTPVRRGEGAGGRGRYMVGEGYKSDFSVCFPVRIIIMMKYVLGLSVFFYSIL